MGLVGWWAGGLVGWYERVTYLVVVDHAHRAEQQLVVRERQALRGWGSGVVVGRRMWGGGMRLLPLTRTQMLCIHRHTDTPYPGTHTHTRTYLNPVIVLRHAVEQPL